MPAGVPEAAEGGWAVLLSVVSIGGIALGVFARNFLAGFRNPERTEEKRVVIETAELADMNGLRGVGAKLAEMHPAVLSTNQNVSKALLILEAQERREDVEREARRMRDEERRHESRQK